MITWSTAAEKWADSKNLDLAGSATALCFAASACESFSSCCSDASFESASAFEASSCFERAAKSMPVPMKWLNLSFSFAASCFALFSRLSAKLQSETLRWLAFRRAPSSRTLLCSAATCSSSPAFEVQRTRSSAAASSAARSSTSAACVAASLRSTCMRCWYSRNSCTVSRTASVRSFSRRYTYNCQSMSDSCRSRRSSRSSFRASVRMLLIKSCSAVRYSQYTTLLSVHYTTVR